MPALKRKTSGGPAPLFDGGIRALNVGVAEFALSPRAHGASVLELDWRPPAGGDRDLGLLLARLEDDPDDPIGSRVAAANARAVERILAAAGDPATAVILLDVVLGYGAHPDPAGALVPAIEGAIKAAAKGKRRLAFVASVCGTAADPQGLEHQEARLAAAGVLLAPSNAQAARLAASLVGHRPPARHRPSARRQG